MAKLRCPIYLPITMIICVVLAGCTTKLSRQTNSKPAITYTIEQKADQPQQLLFTADTSQIGAFRVEAPRQVFGAQSSPPPVLFCHTSGAKVAYNTDTVCDRITWTINLEPEPESGVPIPEQKSYYSPAGWTLLSEYNTLPRIKIGQQYQTIHVCTPEQQGQCSRLAATDEAPTFLIWGAHKKKIAMGNATMTLISDNPQLFNLGLHDVLFQSISKMTETFAITGSEKTDKQNWSIVWLKKDRASGSIGGAAGKQVFLANYPVNKPANKPVESDILSTDAQSHLHRISVHESIHLLSPYQLPLWINESLAEYYAWKMTETAGMVTTSPEDQWQAMKVSYPHAGTGLYAAERKVTDDGNMSFYPLFYVKGAAFWQQLDQQLNNLDSSLDDFIVELNHSETELPAPFVDQMMLLIGEAAWRKLQAQYL